MKTLSQQLREAITKSGMSRYEISKQTGVSQAALSKFILGHRGIIRRGRSHPPHQGMVIVGMRHH